MSYLVYKDAGIRSSGSGVGRKISHPEKPLVSWIATFALFLLCSSVPVDAGLIKPDVDYSNYQTPLLFQMVNRIKAKIAARLGQGENRRDRYFIIPFAYQNKGNSPNYSHSFISVVRVFADQKQPKYTPGLRRVNYRNRNFEAFTISWLPHGIGADRALPGGKEEHDPSID
jgi:hypothetical protein